MPVIPLLLLLASVVFSLTQSATASEDSSQPGEIEYELKEPGNVSLAIYDSQGKIVRELLHAAPQAAGVNKVAWDGKDHDGQALPPDTYSWKLLQTPGLRATYLMSLGSNYPPGKDWRTACGPGTHKAPFGIAADTTGIYVAAQVTENIETCLLKMTPDGKSRVWSALTPRAWDGALSLAVDGGELFMLGHTPWQDARLTQKLPKQCVFVYDAATGNLATRFLADFGTGPQANGMEVQWDPASDDMDASDMDARDEAIVVAYEKRDALRFYNPKDGTMVANTQIPAPQGVALGSEGTVYITTGKEVVRLAQDNQAPVVVATDLDQPGRIAVDHSSGELLVYLKGTKQIVRLSPEGKRLKTYGEPGGRKDGLYNAKTKKSFAGFSDLSSDNAGGFYVTESGAAPRRTAHFAANGSVIEEWYGGQRWAPHAALEGDNPNVLWVGSEAGTVMRVIVDYEKKSWTIHSCYHYSGLANGLVGDSWNEGGYFRVYKHEGATYLALQTFPTILKLDEKEWKLRPVTMCGKVRNAPQFLKDWALEARSTSGWDGSDNYQACFQWNDADGDGLPQQSEVTFYSQRVANNFAPYIAPDFTFWGVTGDAKSRWVNQFAVTSWNPVGAPIYGTLPVGKKFADCPPRFSPQSPADERWSLFLNQDPKTGALYAAINDGITGWCTSKDSFLHKWSATGASEWTVGQLAPGVDGAPAKTWKPGEIRHNLRGLAGVVHDCIVGIDVDGGWEMANPAVSYVWDQDGLFVGGMMDSTDTNGIAPYWYQCGGEFCHASVATLPSGDVIFLGNWENEMRAYRISGWNHWVRQSGQVSLKP